MTITASRHEAGAPASQGGQFKGQNRTEASVSLGFKANGKSSYDVADERFAQREVLIERESGHSEIELQFIMILPERGHRDRDKVRTTVHRSQRNERILIELFDGHQWHTLDESNSGEWAPDADTRMGFWLRRRRDQTLESMRANADAATIAATQILVE